MALSISLATLISFGLLGYSLLCWFLGIFRSALAGSLYSTVNGNEVPGAKFPGSLEGAKYKGGVSVEELKGDSREKVESSRESPCVTVTEDVAKLASLPVS